MSSRGLAGPLVAIRIGRRRNPTPLVLKAPLVGRQPCLPAVGQLRHRQADPTAPNLNRRDLPCRDARTPEPLEIVVVLVERPLEALVERPDELQDVSRRDPERSVKAVGV